MIKAKREREREKKERESQGEGDQGKWEDDGSDELQTNVGGNKRKGEKSQRDSLWACKREECAAEV